LFTRTDYFYYNQDKSDRWLVSLVEM